MHKFGFVENGISKKYDYGNIFQIQTKPNFKRLIVGPTDDQINIAIKLIEQTPPPYWILYILKVSRTNQKTGRYQIPDPMNHTELVSFLKKYSEYFENDGRHELWIASTEDDSQVIYDNHNVLYVYGDLEFFGNVLQNKNFRNVKELKISAPHEHCYNDKYDIEEKNIINEFKWLFTPLKESDL